MTKVLLTKEQILSATDRKFKVIDVPEWGGTVRVAQISVADRLNLQLLQQEKREKEGDKAGVGALILGLCALSIVDEQGTRLFSDEDIEALGKKSAAAIDKIFDAADELNGITAGMGLKLKKN